MKHGTRNEPEVVQGEGNDRAARRQRRQLRRQVDLADIERDARRAAPKHAQQARDMTRAALAELERDEDTQLRQPPRDDD